MYPIGFIYNFYRCFTLRDHPSCRNSLFHKWDDFHETFVKKDAIKGDTVQLKAQ